MKTRPVLNAMIFFSCYFACAVSVVEAQEARHRNVLFISIDEMRNVVAQREHAVVVKELAETLANGWKSVLPTQTEIGR